MGLMDGLQGLLGTSMDDPRTMATLQLAQGLLGRGGGMQRLAGGLQGYGGVMAQAAQAEEEKKRRALQEQMLMQQLEAAKAAQAERAAAAAKQQAIEGAYRGAIRSPAQQALAGGGGPTVGNAAKMQGLTPAIDQNALIQGLSQDDPMAAYQMMAPKPADFKVVGDALVQTNAQGGPKPVYERQKPVDMNQLMIPDGKGGYIINQQLLDAKSQIAAKGATNIGMPRIEVKMGDSVAGQVGPMAKDSRTQAQGAVGMFDSAERIQKALDSGKVSAGPFTTQINTVKQLVQKVGGGNDEGIRQTRQVIKSLAQMAVEARKELAGQGAVTENEAAAVGKAESGDINDLTTGELQDLVTLTKRAAHLRAKSHKGLLDSMGESDGTRGTVPFYQVRGLDRLLQHDPQLPQIGGKATQSSFDDAEKERRYQAWKQQQGRP